MPTTNTKLFGSDGGPLDCQRTDVVESQTGELKNDELMPIPIHIHSSIQSARDLVKLVAPREIYAADRTHRHARAEPALSRRRVHCSGSILVDDVSPPLCFSPFRSCGNSEYIFRKSVYHLRGFSCRIANIIEVYHSCCFVNCSLLDDPCILKESCIPPFMRIFDSRRFCSTKPGYDGPISETAFILDIYMRESLTDRRNRFCSYYGNTYRDNICKLGIFYVSPEVSGKRSARDYLGSFILYNFALISEKEQVSCCAP